jgi:hypothetical protein
VPVVTAPIGIERAEQSPTHDDLPHALKARVLPVGVLDCIGK